MKPIDVKSDCYAEYNVDSDEKDPKFKAVDHVRISKYNNIFAKGRSLVRTSFSKIKKQFHGLLMI